MRRAKRWFPKVLQDLNALADAIEYFDRQLEEAYRDLDIEGNLTNINQRQPGLVAYYDAMHSDLEAILAVVERHLKVTKASVFKEYVDKSPTNRQLSATDLKQLAEADERVQDMMVIYEEVKDRNKQFGSLMKALDSRGYSINNITKLRVAGLEEIEV